MTKTDQKFYFGLLESPILGSKIPKIVGESGFFKSLLDSQILVRVNRNRGYEIRVADQENFKKILGTHFPEGEKRYPSRDARIDGTLRLRNSKASGKKSDGRALLFRGRGKLWVEGKGVPLEKITSEFGLFSLYGRFEIQAKKLCLVENFTPFLQAEKIFPDSEMVFVHPYGRWSLEVFKKFESDQINFFGDYDFLGLSEYLKLKTIHPEAALFIPPDFDLLFEKYSRSFESRQNLSTQLIQSDIPEVKKILHKVRTTQRFLEQESLFGDDSSFGDER